MGVNLEKTNMMIISNTARNVTEKGKFACAVCGKGPGSTAILCKFCKCWVNIRCSDISKVN